MDVQQDLSLNSDITLRLQQIISNWGGAGRGEPLSMLHSQCVDAVGRGNTLLPAPMLHSAMCFYLVTNRGYPYHTPNRNKR